MIRAGHYAELSAFATVAALRSFRRAADQLNLRPSTLSHAVRALEERLGVKLLARTTRAVTPTDAGAALLLSIGPALHTLAAASDVVNAHRIKPQGTLRLTLPQATVGAVLGPRLIAFTHAYPDVTLELSVNDGFVDILREGYDAGIRLGESLAPGMTAVRVSRDIRAALVAAPAYWAMHKAPETPHDLRNHRCIVRRFAPGRGLSPWLFSRAGERLEVTCEGPLIVNSEALMLRAALGGVGVAMMAEEDVADDIAAGRLQRVLEDWCPPIFGFFLYHASQRLASASLRALIETLRV